MWVYFKRKGSNRSGFQIKDDSSLTIHHFHPKVFASFHNFMWSFFSFFSGNLFQKYELLHEGKVVCVAQVVSWIPIFQFMPVKGIHIGPCMTVAEERGKGYYPYLLEEIIGKYPPQKDFYMIIDEKNISSIRGVEKVGFKRYASGEKRFGLYMVNRKDNKNETTSL